VLILDTPKTDLNSTQPVNVEQCSHDAERDVRWLANARCEVAAKVRIALGLSFAELASLLPCQPRAVRIEKFEQPCADTHFPDHESELAKDLLEFWRQRLKSGQLTNGQKKVVELGYQFWIETFLLEVKDRSAAALKVLLFANGEKALQNEKFQEVGKKYTSKNIQARLNQGSLLSPAELRQAMLCLNLIKESPENFNSVWHNPLIKQARDSWVREVTGRGWPESLARLYAVIELAGGDTSIDGLADSNSGPGLRRRIAEHLAWPRLVEIDLVRGTIENFLKPRVGEMFSELMQYCFGNWEAEHAEERAMACEERIEILREQQIAKYSDLRKLFPEACDQEVINVIEGRLSMKIPPGVIICILATDSETCHALLDKKRDEINIYIERDIGRVSTAAEIEMRLWGVSHEELLEQINSLSISKGELKIRIKHTHDEIQEGLVNAAKKLGLGKLNLPLRKWVEINDFRTPSEGMLALTRFQGTRPLAKRAGLNDSTILNIQNEVDNPGLQTYCNILACMGEPLTTMREMAWRERLACSFKKREQHPLLNAIDALVYEWGDGTRARYFSFASPSLKAPATVWGQRISSFVNGDKEPLVKSLPTIVPDISLLNGNYKITSEQRICTIQFLTLLVNSSPTVAFRQWLQDPKVLASSDLTAAISRVSNFSQSEINKLLYEKPLEELDIMSLLEKRWSLSRIKVGDEFHRLSWSVPSPLEKDLLFIIRCLPGMSPQKLLEVLPLAIEQGTISLSQVKVDASEKLFKPNKSILSAPVSTRIIDYRTSLDELAVLLDAFKEHAVHWESKPVLKTITTKENNEIKDTPPDAMKKDPVRRRPRLDSVPSQSVKHRSSKESPSMVEVVLPKDLLPAVEKNLVRAILIEKKSARSMLELVHNSIEPCMPFLKQDRSLISTEGIAYASLLKRAAFSNCQATYEQFRQAKLGQEKFGVGALRKAIDQVESVKGVVKSGFPKYLEFLADVTRFAQLEKNFQRILLESIDNITRLSSTEILDFFRNALQQWDRARQDNHYVAATPSCQLDVIGRLIIATSK
jgi:transcriptional regulator with XRE-family HTH domain